MWTRFMKVSDGGRACAVVALVQGKGTFRWVPNFGEWVRDRWAAEDLGSVRLVNAFTEVTAEEASRLVESLPRLDRRTFGWVLDALGKEPRRLTCAELGLDVRAKTRPSATGGLLESVREAPPGVWVKARVFPPSKALAARKWVSEVRLGRIKHFDPLGPLEAVLARRDDGSYEARVRRSVAGVSLPDLARSLATRAHGLQVDKAGNAYIDHPRRVAERLESWGAPPEAVAAGWLHDVLEDTAMTAADLVDAGVPDEVVAAVEAVSRRDGESMEVYAARVAASPTGLLVKRADMADNTDPERLGLLDAVTRKRLEAKYASMAALLDEDSAEDARLVAV